MTCVSPKKHDMQKNVSGEQFKAAKKQKVQFPRVIEHIFSPNSQQILLNFIDESLHNITRTFFDGSRPPEIERLETISKSQSHTKLLILFFLLLNVDADLKGKILEMEDPCRHEKLIRFFLDLKHHYIIKFLTDMSITLAEFVQLCHECYIQA